MVDVSITLREWESLWAIVTDEGVVFKTATLSELDSLMEDEKAFFVCIKSGEENTIYFTYHNYVLPRGNSTVKRVVAQAMVHSKEREVEKNA